MVDIVVENDLFYYANALGEIDDAIHLKPESRDPHEQVIALDADYASKASIKEICGTITHELIHYYLEREHGWLVSWEYENIAHEFEDWRDRHDPEYWRDKLLEAPRPTCPTCVWARPYTHREHHERKGEYKTVSCGKNIRPTLDTFARACEDYRPQRGFNPYIPEPTLSEAERNPVEEPKECLSKISEDCEGRVDPNDSRHWTLPRGAPCGVDTVQTCKPCHDAIVDVVREAFQPHSEELGEGSLPSSTSIHKNTPKGGD